MGLSNKKISRIKINKPALRFFVIIIAIFTIITLLLFNVNIWLNEILMVDKVDTTKAVALRYKFEAVQFQSGYFTSDLTGEKSTLLNVTFNDQEKHLYSEALQLGEIQKIGILDVDGQIYLLIFNSEVEDGEYYVINANSTSLFEYGTTEEVIAFFVQDFREIGLLEELVPSNRLLFTQLGILVFMLTAICGMILVGVVLWFITSIEFIIVGVFQQKRRKIKNPHGN